MTIIVSNGAAGAGNSIAPGNLISAIADWCASVSGQKPLRSGLRALGEALGCDAIAVSRIQNNGPEQSRLVSCDLNLASASDTPLTVSFARNVLREYAEKSKPGSLWFSSMFDGNLAPRLTEFQRRRRLKEMVIIPIATSSKQTDFLELHYAEKRDVDQIALLDQVSNTIVKTWTDRSAGLFSDALLSRKPEPAAVDPAVPLLHIKNPARLSRCEYRVCLLISHGLNGAAIQGELNISHSTLRTHLRNIYAKTETGSLAELTFLLLSHSGLPLLDQDTEKNIA